MAKHQTGGTAAVRALLAAGIDFSLHEYEHDPRSLAFGEEAASALGVDPRQIFKTLIAVLVPGKPELVTAVVPVAGQLDLKALALALDAKRADLAAPEVAERSTGYVVGGISPLGQKQPLRTVVDSSAETFATIYVSAGRRGQQVEVSPHDLARLTGGRFAPIGR